MAKLAKTVFLLSLLFTFLGCPSTPPVVDDTQDTVTTDTIDAPVDVPVDPPTDTKSPVSEEEFLAVEKAIQRAVDAEADKYSPQLLAKARSNLQKARELGVSDPDTAKNLLAEASKDAQAAYEASLLAQQDQYLTRLEKTQQQLLNIEADKFYPREFNQAIQKKDRARELFQQGDLTGARAMADEAQNELNELLTKLTGRLSVISSLRQEVSSSLEEAEVLEAYIWTPDTLEEANDAYLQGAESLSAYNLDASEESFTQAKYLAQMSLAESREQKAKKETEDLMLETMRKIEKASGLTTVDDTGRVIRPQTWDGRSILDRMKTQPPVEPPQAFPSQPILLDGTPSVMAEVDRVTYLTKAKELWQEGVIQKESGNFPVANQLFLEAQRYIALYESLAVDKFYIVKLVPERRESLWRISEFASIYGDPFSWPRIWKRNKNLIKNPDLIYPGWTLIIPPK